MPDTLEENDGKRDYIERLEDLGNEINRKYVPIAGVVFGGSFGAYLINKWNTSSDFTPIHVWMLAGCVGAALLSIEQYLSNRKLGRYDTKIIS